MITQELIDLLIEKYKAGESKQHIIDSLIEKGYEEKDINEAVRHIQKSTVAQMPVVSTVVDAISRINSAIANPKSAKSGIGILGIILLGMVVACIYLYRIFSPGQVVPVGQSSQLETAVPVVSGAINLEISGTAVVQHGSSAIGFSGAQVKVTDSQGHIVCQMTTDQSGAFICKVLSEGAYKVYLSKTSNFQVEGKDPVSINVPDDSNILFTLYQPQNDQ
jgi:hypothetical protein